MDKMLPTSAFRSVGFVLDKALKAFDISIEGKDPLLKDVFKDIDSKDLERAIKEEGISLDKYEKVKEKCHKSHYCKIWRQSK